MNPTDTRWKNAAQVLPGQHRVMEAIDDLLLFLTDPINEESQFLDLHDELTRYGHKEFGAALYRDGQALAKEQAKFKDLLLDMKRAIKAGKVASSLPDSMKWQTESIEKTLEGVVRNLKVSSDAAYQAKVANQKLTEAASNLKNVAAQAQVEMQTVLRAAEKGMTDVPSREVEKALTLIRTAFRAAATLRVDEEGAVESAAWELRELGNNLQSVQQAVAKAK